MFNLVLLKIQLDYTVLDNVISTEYDGFGGAGS